MTKCYECKYEHSDCKGNKQDDCPNFAKRGAFNYHAKIRELEKTLEQADKSYAILAKENEALLLRADRLEAERNELKAKCELFSDFVIYQILMSIKHINS